MDPYSVVFRNLKANSLSNIFTAISASAFHSKMKSCPTFVVQQFTSIWTSFNDCSHYAITYGKTTLSSHNKKEKCYTNSIA